MRRPEEARHVQNQEDGTAATAIPWVLLKALQALAPQGE
jgi:hypothetical protein